MAANRLTLCGWLRPTSLVCALLCFVALMLSTNAAYAQKQPSVFDDEVFSEPFADTSFGECETCDSDAAFDSWESIVEDDASVHWHQPELKPFDWVRHFGFRHSSTHGRHIGRGIPLEGTSWKNRPYHVDWFSGSLLSDDLIGGRIAQDNELFGGLRLGWDFDYYWGIETRFGWSKPNIQFNAPQPVASNGDFFVSDVDIVYYPWGDSKIRPYMLLGAGIARIRFTDDNNTSFNTTHFTTPFGGGVQFRQWPWLVWRLEVLDNLSYGADGVDTMHNISLTAGMELRLGARPASYWPWRSSRRIW